jgi:hypothetical protein
MAQGFKRTGNAFSAKKASTSSSSSSSAGSNKIRKGARFIAPKKTAAMAKVNLTHKLTAQLNRRAESALITRLGGNREGALKLVRADSQIVEELKAKKAKKEAGRNSSASVSKKESDESSEKSESLNSLTKSALQQLNEQESFEAEASKMEDDQDQELL